MTHHTADVGDSKVRLFKMGRANTLVLWRVILENVVTVLSVRLVLQMIAHVYAFPASIELIEKFVKLLARRMSLKCTLTYSALSASRKELSNLLRRASRACCPCSDRLMRVLCEKRRTTEHAAPFVVNKRL